MQSYPEVVLLLVLLHFPAPVLAVHLVFLEHHSLQGASTTLRAHNGEQWRFQSCQVTRAGDKHGMRGKLMGGEKSGPSP